MLVFVWMKILKQFILIGNLMDNTMMILVGYLEMNLQIV